MDLAKWKQINLKLIGGFRFSRSTVLQLIFINYRITEASAS